jgi:DNA replication protein DnaC
MLNEQTHQQLMDMKMYALASSFQEYLDQAKPDKLPFEERFGLMVDREWAARQERRLKRRLSSAKLREQACLEDIDYRHPRKLDRSVMQRLATCKWIANHDNVLITGETGLGKTWLACALANKGCREGYSAIYSRVPRLLPALKIARGDGSYEKELRRLAKANVLILDDWGLASLEDSERRDVLEILEDRHGRGSTIVTSQLPVKKWHAVIGDPTIADAILDRLVHNAHRIEMKGPSIRKNRAGRGDE